MKFQFEITEHTITFERLTPMGIEQVFLPSAAELKQSTVTMQTRRHISTQSNEKYIEKRFNFVTIGTKITNDL